MRRPPCDTIYRLRWSLNVRDRRVTVCDALGFVLFSALLPTDELSAARVMRFAETLQASGGHDTALSGRVCCASPCLFTQFVEQLHSTTPSDEARTLKKLRPPQEAAS